MAYVISLPASEAHECCDEDTDGDDPRKRCDSEDLPCSPSIAMTSFMSFSSAPASCSLWCIGRAEDQACVLSKRERSFEASSVSGEGGGVSLLGVERPK
jgi:hypothetical protein